MITINDYGVKLIQLTEDKIELVRHWRNSYKIRKYMEYRDYITSEMQKQWFEKISSTTNDFFFLIVVNDVEVGLINIKDIDWQKKCGESGIFIWDDSYLHCGISYRAALCQRDFAFNVLHLDYIIAHILNTNIRSIKYNQRFGFTLSTDECPIRKGEANQLYILTKEKYKKHKTKIMEIIIKRTILSHPPRAVRRRYKTVIHRREYSTIKVLN